MHYYACDFCRLHFFLHILNISDHQLNGGDGSHWDCLRNVRFISLYHYNPSTSFKCICTWHRDSGYIIELTCGEASCIEKFELASV